MPYNNAPISPPDEITGTSSLPLARVKKIIAQDEDISQCSNNAAFAISVATEIFIRYLTEQAYNVVKSERKPRRNIAYKDIATAVSRIDNLEFLADIVPKTKTYRQFREEAAQQEEAKNAMKPGSGPFGLPNGTNGNMAPTQRTISIMMQEQTDGPSDASRSNGILHAPTSSPSQPLNGSPIVDRTLHVSQHAHPGDTGDVEMEG